MDKKKAVLNYEVPQVEIIEVEVEKGFATSGNGQGNGQGEDGEWGTGVM